MARGGNDFGFYFLKLTGATQAERLASEILKPAKAEASAIMPAAAAATSSKPKETVVQPATPAPAHGGSLEPTGTTGTTETGAGELAALRARLEALEAAKEKQEEELKALRLENEKRQAEHEAWKTDKDKIKRWVSGGWVVGGGWDGWKEGNEEGQSASFLICQDPANGRPVCCRRGGGGGGAAVAASFVGASAGASFLVGYVHMHETGTQVTRKVQPDSFIRAAAACRLRLGKSERPQVRSRQLFARPAS